MAKIIRNIRIARPHFKQLIEARKGKIYLPPTSGTAEITDIVHESGRGAPLAEMMMDGNKYLTLSTEGMYKGQIISVDQNKFAVGNVVRAKQVPEGTVLCMLEQEPMDGGKIAVASGLYALLISHNKDTNTCVVKLPSGQKKTLSGDVRGFVGIISGAGRTEKPLLKAGRAFHKYKAKGVFWPRVRGVAMNPVEHPHGGGNHQHIGHPSTIKKSAPPGQRVGLIGARRTGLRRGSRNKAK